MNNLSKILKTKRAEKGMSLRDFSEYLGISHAYLSKLEKGYDPKTGKEIAPTIDTLLKLSDGLDIPSRKFLEICGYIDKSHDIVKEERLPEGVEVKDYIDDFIDNLFVSANLTINGEPISREDLQHIADALRIALEIALKKFE